MKDIDINGHRVSVYRSMQDLPMANLNRFNFYTITESEIGSDMGAIERHFQRLDQFHTAGDLKAAIEERVHMHYAFFNILNQVNLPAFAFASLVQAIDGEPVTDLSDSGLQATVARLEAMGITMGTIMTATDELKKNSGLN